MIDRSKSIKRSENAIKLVFMPICQQGKIDKLTDIQLKAFFATKSAKKNIYI